MYPKIVELELDRNLIKPNFDGYKLALSSVPILKQNLTLSPFRAKQSDEQYSFLHAEIFSMHNHLIQDPWDPNSSYYFATNGDFMKTYYDENIGQPLQARPMYRIMDPCHHKSGDYNVSFHFVSEKFGIFCDGSNKISLIDTGDRCKNAEWKLVYNKCNVSDEIQGFIIRDSRLDIIDEVKQISFALQHVHNDGKSFLTQIFWGVLKEVSKEHWEFNLKDVLSGKSSLCYCAFEPKAESLIVCSNKEFIFKSKETTNMNEELKEISEKIDDNSKKTNDNSENQTKPEDITTLQESSYSWSQSDDDITIRFSPKEGKVEHDYKVQCTKTTISVKCIEEVLLEDTLFSAIDPDLTTWTLENDFLQVTLIKENTTSMWPFLVENGPKTSSNSIHTKTTVLDGKPIANLEAQIEECDFPVNTMEEDYAIQRLNFEAGTTTHKIILGNNAPIFTTCLRPGFPAAIITRQDVDASIWLQQYNPSKPHEWKLRHEGNLHAFGYVQASKEQRKFINCSADLSYAVICESHRHVFVYKNNYDTASGLRNRNGPQISVGKQHLVTLKDVGEVLGMSTTDNFITLLTEKCILYLQINAS